MLWRYISFIINQLNLSYLDISLIPSDHENTDSLENDTEENDGNDDGSDDDDDGLIRMIKIFPSQKWISIPKLVELWNKGC